jgi:hypothetical protein
MMIKDDAFNDDDIYLIPFIYDDGDDNGDD